MQKKQLDKYRLCYNIYLCKDIKCRPKVKNVQEKNIKSAINAASAQTNHVQVKDMNAAADYSCSISERIN